jgi:hypothetical protein
MTHIHTSGEFDMSTRTEKSLLQLCIAIGAFVPVLAGLCGVLTGSDFIGLTSDVSADSHFRYLSGLLLGIGLGFWSCIPDIEAKTNRFGLLTLIVVIGGLSRLISLIFVGVPPNSMLFGLGMELIITPLLYFWQSRVAGQSRVDIASQ